MNSRGYTVTSISIAFMAVTLLLVPGFGGNAYAAGVGMSIHADASSGSHSIMISGETDRSDPVMIIVTAPNGNIVAVDQVTPTGNSYSTTIGVGGSQYKQDGMYTILVQQGAESGDSTESLSTVWKGGQDKYKLSVMFEVTSGTTSVTSITKSSCYGTTGDQNRPCNYDLSSTGGTMSDSIHVRSISDGPLTITADAIRGSTTINVSGTTTQHAGDIMLKVISPNGNIVAVDQVTPSDGSYSATISIGGNQYNQDGMYSITATQAHGSLANTSLSNVYQSITASTEIEIVDGYVIPEFGTIAAMILVVAIVAIIAVSAKTKLSLVPRY